MRGVGFALAVAALFGAGTNWWMRTRPLLERLPALRADLASALDGGIAHARTSGAPPTAHEIEVARELAHAGEQERDLLARFWFEGARDAADYLYPVAARPRTSDGDVAARLSELLLELPAACKEFPGLTTTRMGLVLPTLDRPLALAPDEQRDQLERAIATRLLARALRRHAPVLVEAAAASRDEGGSLVVRMTLQGTLDSTVGIVEALGARDEGAPPRRLDRVALARVEPDEWRPTGPAFASPPLRLKVALTFHFPGAKVEGR